MSNPGTLPRPSAAIRKAAVLIATLDTPTADKLLDKMPPDQAAQVRQAVMDLDRMVPDEQEDVIREFMGNGVVTTQEQDGGVELAAELAQKLRTPGGYELEPQVGEIHGAPFQALCDASVDVLARHLERQHPQAIALVVAHFPPPRAAAVIEHFSPTLQADVLRRVADLGPADPDVIRDVEQELEQLLSVEIRAARHRIAGLSTVAAIVNAAGSRRDGLLGNLERHNREFASQLGEVVQPTPSGENRNSRVASHEARVTSRSSTAEAQMPGVASEGSDERDQGPAIAFEDLTGLGDDDWAELIRAVDSRILLLSLAGASEQLVGRIAGQLPRREGRDFRRRLEQVGPVQLADLRLAQRHLARCASRLAARGVIRSPQRKTFAAAA